MSIVNMVQRELNTGYLDYDGLFRENLSIDEITL